MKRFFFYKTKIYKPLARLTQIKSGMKEETLQLIPLKYKGLKKTTMYNQISNKLENPEDINSWTHVASQDRIMKKQKIGTDQVEQGDRISTKKSPVRDLLV